VEPVTLVRILKALWGRWKLVAHKIANFQSRALLFIFYYLVLGPFALAAKALSDPLRLRPAAPAWLTRPPFDGEVLARARRQF